MRNLRPASAAALAGDWGNGAARFDGRQLLDKTLGILGVGLLGAMTARFGQAFGMRVLGCDLKPIAVPGVEQVGLDDLLAASDAVSIHIHLHEGTRALLNASRLAQMKPGAVLVNTSRGDIVEETAVIDALRSGRLGAYGADVVHDEWRPDMDRHPLVVLAAECPRIVLTPHIGGSTRESVIESRRFMARKLIHFLTHREELVWPAGASEPLVRPSHQLSGPRSTADQL